MSEKESMELKCMRNNKNNNTKILYSRYREMDSHKNSFQRGIS